MGFTVADWAPGKVPSLKGKGHNRFLLSSVAQSVVASFL